MLVAICFCVLLCIITTCNPKRGKQMNFDFDFDCHASIFYISTKVCASTWIVVYHALRNYWSTIRILHQSINLLFLSPFILFFKIILFNCISYYLIFEPALLFLFFTLRCKFWNVLILLYGFSAYKNFKNYMWSWNQKKSEIIFLHGPSGHGNTQMFYTHKKVERESRRSTTLSTFECLLQI